MRITSDAAGLFITSTATTASAFSITAENTSAAGSIMTMFNNTAFVSSNPAIAFGLLAASTGDLMFLDQDGSGVTLDIDSESTSNSALRIDMVTSTGAAHINLASQVANTTPVDGDFWYDDDGSLRFYDGTDEFDLTAGGGVNIFYGELHDSDSGDNIFNTLKEAIDAYNLSSAKYAVFVMTAFAGFINPIPSGGDVTCSKGFEIRGGGVGIQKPMLTFTAGDTLTLDGDTSIVRKYVFNGIEINMDARTNACIDGGDDHVSFEVTDCDITHNGTAGSTSVAWILANVDIDGTELAGAVFRRCKISHSQTTASRHLFGLTGSSQKLGIYMEDCEVIQSASNSATSHAFFGGSFGTLQMRLHRTRVDEKMMGGSSTLIVAMDDLSVVRMNQGTAITFDTLPLSASDFDPMTRTVSVDPNIGTDSEGGGVFSSFADAVLYLNHRGGGHIVLKSHVFAHAIRADGTAVQKHDLNGIRVSGSSNLDATRVRIMMGGGATGASLLSANGEDRVTCDFEGVDFMSFADRDYTYDNLSGTFILDEIVSIRNSSDVEVAVATVALDNETDRMQLYLVSGSTTSADNFLGATSTATADIVSSATVSSSAVLYGFGVAAGDYVVANFNRCSFNTTNSAFFTGSNFEGEFQFVGCNQSSMENRIFDLTETANDNCRITWLGHRFNPNSVIYLATVAASAIVTLSTDLLNSQFNNSITGTMTINSSQLSTEDEVSTTDATVTTLTTIALEDDTQYQLDARILVVEDDGTDRAVYKRSVAVYRTGAGNATLLGSANDDLTEESGGASAWDATIDIDSTSVRIRVTGEAAHDLNWKSRYELVKVAE